MSGMDSLNRNIGKAFKGAIISGAGAGIGGLIGGPIGVAIGGSVAATISAAFLDFRSASNVLENDFTPNERQELLERGRLALCDLKEWTVKLILQILNELKNCKSFEDFKCHVLMPLLYQFIGEGVKELIRHIIANMSA